MIGKETGEESFADLVSPVPNETTLCRFRNLLADKGLTKKLMNELSAQLDKKRLLVKRGTLVDASLVMAFNIKRMTVPEAAA